MSTPLKSMTAYGRGESKALSVEIQSVNRRHLEVSVNLPRLLTRFEMQVRKAVTKRVGRGQVNVFIRWGAETASTISVRPNLQLARGVKEAWEKIAYDLGIEQAVDLRLLAREKDLFVCEEELPDEAGFEKALMLALDEALDQLVEMKGREGEALTQDINAQIDVLEHAIIEIEKRAGGATEKYREKLAVRLEELFSGEAENEERALKEVAIYAERVDITEEIVRFKSHLVQFRELAERAKALEFLVQELNREINTIGSKASDVEITRLVVSAKSALEKIREQLQNVE